MTETVALIVAAGRGERAGGDIPKQFRLLCGKPVLRWAVEAFLRHPKVGAVQAVIHPDDCELYAAAVAGLSLSPAVTGGETRADSVRGGLEALAKSPPRHVLIHDGARPFPSPGLIERVAGALGNADAAAPLLPITDTVRRRTATGYELMPRDALLRAQTPQGFRFEKILDAHRRFAGAPATDDISLAEWAEMTIAAVDGDKGNIKLTTADDFVMAEKLALAALADVRTGSGFDAHRFGPGDHIWLCGVKIPNGATLVGHSDADVGLHALTDAVLGALGEADIGAHFPPTDERWRGASSRIFLAHAAELVRVRGGVISHVDVTLICERPKLALHRDAMRSRIAEILSVEIGRVSVKATTSDGLGFTGRSEGIAAQAVATVRLPG
jgi:2-C-methyl-D-erythritol 4-phosphate cytidylyltransferase / 2-C-methyl-D-erythritol 2,4-cyclodiphosphate synthase